MQITTSTGSYTIDETEICDDSQGSLDIQNDILGNHTDEDNFCKVGALAGKLASERHPNGYNYEQWDTACHDASASLR